MPFCLPFLIEQQGEQLQQLQELHASWATLKELAGSENSANPYSWRIRSGGSQNL